MNSIQYLRLKAGGPFWEKAPKDLILYNDMIKTSTEWESLGFKVRPELKGSSRYKEYKIGKYWYNFRECSEYDIKNNSQILEAITKRVKFIYYPYDIYINRKLGISYEQMINIDEHIKFYAEARILFDQNQFASALDLISKSLSVKPNDNNYKLLLFDIQFQLKDLTAIDEILSYFKNDIDSYIHSGHLIDWVRLLAKSKDYSKTYRVIETVNKLLDDLIEGNRKSVIYLPQNRDWYIYKKDEFNKKFEKLQIRIKKHLQ